VFSDATALASVAASGAGHVAHHVGALSYGTHPRHGGMWNKGNRDLSVLDWEKIHA
jgi:hypothetical protein